MDKLCLLFVILFTNMVQTISGFAGTMLAMPVSILLVGITDAKIILNTVGLFCCIVMAFQNYRSIEYREFFRIIAAMSLGMLLAQGISGRIRLEFLLVVYGLLIIIIAVRGLMGCREVNLSGPAIPFLLVAAGILHGLFLSGGALLVIYARQRFPDKSVFRATLTAVWVFLNSLILAGHLFGGQITPVHLKLILPGMAVSLLGVYFGNLLHNRISRERFAMLANILLILSGSSILL